MATGNRKYSPEFKDEAAREVVSKSRPIVDVARELGVPTTTLAKWVGKLRDDLDDSGEKLSAEERAKISQMSRRIRELEEENSFLKKASAFFARNQH
jgi:transposase